LEKKIKFLFVVVIVGQVDRETLGKNCEVLKTTKQKKKPTTKLLQTF
jgi:hypothetical protein